MADKRDLLSRLHRDLSDPVPVPREGIERAVEIMRSGRLFRYGEFAGGGSQVANLEREFAQYMGSRYAVAVNSCGCAIFLALKAAGVEPGDRVLVNAFTLAPVPGAIEHAGAEPVLVECSDGYRIDLEDLERRAGCGARVLLLSHMRGHIVDMERINRICALHDLLLIEDCAHTLGARWDGQLSGSFGTVACFSLQTFKHINAGEGGVLTTDDEDIAARAILYSGSYMLYQQNGARPALEVFERHKAHIPNFSMRMHEVTAALARPQIALLETRAARLNEHYALLAGLLNEIPGVDVPPRPSLEAFVPSSIQFSLTGLDATAIEAVLAACKARGLDIKWFGSSSAVGFTSTWEHWRYLAQPQDLPATRNMLEALCDMRIPLALSADDCHLIAEILGDAMHQVTAR